MEVEVEVEMGVEVGLESRKVKGRVGQKGIEVGN